jgi:hypothetical protein
VIDALLIVSLGFVLIGYAVVHALRGEWTHAVAAMTGYVIASELYHILQAVEGTR